MRSIPSCSFQWRATLSSISDVASDDPWPESFAKSGKVADIDGYRDVEQGLEVMKCVCERGEAMMLRRTCKRAHEAVAPCLDDVVVLVCLQSSR